MEITKRDFLVAFLSQFALTSTAISSKDDMNSLIEKLNMSEDFNQTVKNISERLGLIRVYVHPFYISKDKTMDQGDPKVQDLSKKIESGLWKNLDSVYRSPKSAPLFIFEEKNEMDSLKSKIIGKYGKIPPGIFMIPTEEGTGIPDIKIFGNRENEIPYEQMTTEEIEFKQIFKKLFFDILKVRSIILGGAYFDLETSDKGEQVPVKCAGDIYRWFKEIGVTDIKLSRFLELDRDELRLKGLR